MVKHPFIAATHLRIGFLNPREQSFDQIFLPTYWVGQQKKRLTASDSMCLSVLNLATLR